MIKIHDITNSIFTSKTYILYKEGENKTWLVDIGDFEPVMAFSKEKNLSVEGVFLTHAHFDHIYGLPELLGLFPDCRVYTNEAGRETLADTKQNLSFFQGSPLSVIGPQVLVSREGDEIELFPDVMARVYETPGHHPSCLTFMVGDFLFTGDAFIPGIKVVTNLPKADKKLAQESLERINKLSEGKQILPGHQV